MNFTLNEAFELPLVITRGYVGYPNSQITLSVERKFSSDAVEASINNFESYCVLVSQKNITLDNANDSEDIYKVGVIAKISNSEKNKVGFRVRFNSVKELKLFPLETKMVFFMAPVCFTQI